MIFFAVEKREADLETDGRFYRNENLNGFPYSIYLKTLLKEQLSYKCCVLGINRILKKLLLTGDIFK